MQHHKMIHLITMTLGSLGEMTVEHMFILVAALINVGVLVGGLAKLSQISTHVQKTFDYFAIEHEILIRDYCERNNIKLTELPTRLGRAPWWPSSVERGR